MSAPHVPAAFAAAAPVSCAAAQGACAVPAPALYVGTIRQIIPSYVDNSIGYNVSLDDDPRPNRLWFFLQAQLSPA